MPTPNTITPREQATAKGLGYDQTNFDDARMMANTLNRLQTMYAWYQTDEAVRVGPDADLFGQGNRFTRTLGRATAKLTGGMLEEFSGETDESARKTVFWNSMLPMIAIEYMFALSGKQTTDQERRTFLSLFPAGYRSGAHNEAYFDSMIKTVQEGIKSRLGALSPGQQRVITGMLKVGKAEARDVLTGKLSFLKSQGGRIPPSMMRLYEKAEQFAQPENTEFMDKARKDLQHAMDTDGPLDSIYTGAHAAAWGGTQDANAVQKNYGEVARKLFSGEDQTAQTPRVGLPELPGAPAQAQPQGFRPRPLGPVSPGVLDNPDAFPDFFTPGQ